MIQPDYSYTVYEQYGVVDIFIGVSYTREDIYYVVQLYNMFRYLQCLRKVSSHITTSLHCLVKNGSTLFDLKQKNFLCVPKHCQ